ncbi:MAG: hypothetical protein ABW189_06665 [Rickettsiales bacterium]
MHRRREIEALLDAYAHTVKRMAATQARKSWYELEDFALTKKMGINRFILTPERRTVAGQEQWWGTFEYGQKKLKVIATLERD